MSKPVPVKKLFEGAFKQGSSSSSSPKVNFLLKVEPWIYFIFPSIALIAELSSVNSIGVLKHLSKLECLKVEEFV